MYETFIDLDELIILCRDKSAKKFIQEAVACYRVGAYRSCIVSTWNAVVFDFVHKLRQLDQVGNGEASELLQSFENMSQNSEVRKLWEFESKIPELALSKFELISSIEKVDITRLFEDRSRCAHPSMASLEEPFEATAELARYHMRSAVAHLLQRPPVQGRSALNRIWQDIKSAYFPIEPTLAAQYLLKGPLGRARNSLIKDIVVGLTVSLLTEDLPDDERERQFSGLNAIALMYQSEVRDVLAEKLSSIILDKVTDENWEKVVRYLRWDMAVENSNEPCRLKATTFIQKINVSKRINWQNEEILVNASHINFLMDAVRIKLREAPQDEVLDLKNRLHDEMTSFLPDILKETIQTYVETFAQARSFDFANSYANKVCKISSLMTSIQKEVVLNAFCENIQLYGSFNAPGVIKHLFEEDTKHSSSLESYWLSFRKRLQEVHPNNFEDLKQIIDSYAG
jgi:hypothetical protein